MSDDQTKAAQDAVLHGMGVVQGGKHIPLDSFYADRDRIAALTADNERLRGLVEELADDLEVEVRDRWGYDERLAHKLKRDMDVIVRARAALAGKAEQ